MKPKPIDELDCVYNAILNGIPCIFTEDRVERFVDPDTTTYMYDVRHDDTGEPCTIEKHVIVDFYGTIIIGKPIDELESNKTDHVIITNDDTILDDNHYYANLDIDYSNPINLAKQFKDFDQKVWGDLSSKYSGMKVIEIGDT